MDEVIALSKRYKFVTPYTVILAAPRSLLRPRRIRAPHLQPEAPTVARPATRCGWRCGRTRT